MLARLFFFVDERRLLGLFFFFYRREAARLVFFPLMERLRVRGAAIIYAFGERLLRIQAWSFYSPCGWRLLAIEFVLVIGHSTC